jgi:hypothetical protein
VQALQPLQKTQLQRPLNPSVDSLCHPCITTTHLSYNVLSLKLPPPPYAVLLVNHATNGMFLAVRPRHCKEFMPGWYNPWIKLRTFWHVIQVCILPKQVLICGNVWNVDKEELKSCNQIVLRTGKQLPHNCFFKVRSQEMNEVRLTSRSTGTGPAFNRETSSRYMKTLQFFTPSSDTLLWWMNQVKNKTTYALH